MKIGGVIYELEKNDNGNNLHSGEDYYQKRIWKVEKQSENEITFLLYSPDGDQGYPGALEMHVTYMLDDDNGLNIHYEAVPAQDTVINMTNHSYFNLNGHDSGTVLGLKVTLNADCFTPADAESIRQARSGAWREPLWTSAEEKCWERKSTQTTNRFVSAAAMTHNWVLKNEGRFAKVAEVVSDKSGIRMEVYTDLPGVQMYTANFLDHLQGKNGAVYEKRDAVCLETQYFPDAVHHDNFHRRSAEKGKNMIPILHTVF